MFSGFIFLQLFFTNDLGVRVSNNHVIRCILIVINILYVYQADKSPNTNFCFQAKFFICLYTYYEGHYWPKKVLNYCWITMSYSKTQPPDFPPKGSRHFISNFLLSTGILAQYKTFHVSFK